MSASNTPSTLRSRALPIGLLLAVLIAVAVVAIVLTLTNKNGSTGAAGAPGGSTSPVANDQSTSAPARTVQGGATAKQAAAAQRARAEAAAAKAKAARAKAARAAGSQTTTASKPTKSITYTVKPGDNLTVIAAWFHEHGYGKLYQLNRATIGKNPDLIFPGQKITITPGAKMTFSQH